MFFLPFSFPRFVAAPQSTYDLSTRDQHLVGYPEKAILFMLTGYSKPFYLPSQSVSFTNQIFARSASLVIIHFVLSFHITRPAGLLTFLNSKSISYLINIITNVILQLTYLFLTDLR